MITANALAIIALPLAAGIAEDVLQEVQVTLCAVAPDTVGGCACRFDTIAVTVAAPDTELTAISIVTVNPLAPVTSAAFAGVIANTTNRFTATLPPPLTVVTFTNAICNALINAFNPAPLLTPGIAPPNVTTTRSAPLATAAVEAGKPPKYVPQSLP